MRCYHCGRNFEEKEKLKKKHYIDVHDINQKNNFLKELFEKITYFLFKNVIGEMSF